MTVNKTQFQGQKRLPNELKTLRHQMRALKVPQPVGLDSLSTDYIDFEITFSGVTSGDFRTQIINFNNPSFFDVYESELGFSVYVDADNSSTHHWPDGSALTTIPVTWPLQLSWQYDPVLSDEFGSGRKTYTLFLVNNSGNTRTYYLHGRLLFPAATIT